MVFTETEGTWRMVGCEDWFGGTGGGLLESLCDSCRCEPEESLDAVVFAVVPEESARWTFVDLLAGV